MGVEGPRDLERADTCVARRVLAQARQVVNATGGYDLAGPDVVGGSEAAPCQAWRDVVRVASDDGRHAGGVAFARLRHQAATFPREQHRVCLVQAA